MYTISTAAKQYNLTENEIVKLFDNKGISIRPDIRLTIDQLLLIHRYAREKGSLPSRNNYQRATFREKRARQKETSYKTYKKYDQKVQEQICEPVLSVGTVLFYDYRVNNFGFISKIRNDKKLEPSRIRFTKEDINSKWVLSDNQRVVFYLKKDQGQITIKNVTPFKELKLENVRSILHLLKLSDVEQLEDSPFRSNLSFLSDQQKQEIGNLLLGFIEPKSWEYLQRINLPVISDQFLEKSYSRPFEVKMQMLKICYSKRLFESILERWHPHANKEDLLYIVDLAKKHHLKLDSAKILSQIQGIEFSYTEYFAIYNVVRDAEILIKGLSKFTFIDKSLYVTSNFHSLKDIQEGIQQLDSAYKLVHSIFQQELPQLSAKTLWGIYSNLKWLNLIESTKRLFEIIKDKWVDKEVLYNIVKDINDDVDKAIFTEVLIKNKHDFRFYLDKFYALKKPNITEAYIDVEFILYESIDDKIRFFKTFDYSSDTIALKYIVSAYKEFLTKYNPYLLLRLSLKVENEEGQKLAISNLRFEEEHDLVEFIKFFNDSKLSASIKNANKPFAAYASFWCKRPPTTLNKDVITFINTNEGLAQLLLIKAFFYNYHKKFYDLPTLKDLLASHTWSDISAILIKSFISESSFNEKYILDKLNDVFKEHFKSLLVREIDPITFKRTFAIRGLFNKCNGRKQYDGELWRGNGTARWYVKGIPSLKVRGIAVEYCEGKPWKKEPLWDSYTNKASTEQYDFYWCRGSYCAQRNETVNFDQPFHKWTLNEITQLLDLKVEKNVFATLSGWTNRMNEIVEKLVCRSCNEVLRPFPFQPKTLGHYAVPLFQCINHSCDMNEVPIRFTHCLNGKCANILDSRDCSNCCSTGLVCNTCGTKCPRCSGHYVPIVVQDNW